MRTLAQLSRAVAVLIFWLSLLFIVLTGYVALLAVSILFWRAALAVMFA